MAKPGDRLLLRGKQNSRTRFYLVGIHQRGRARQDRLRPEKTHEQLHFAFQLLSSF